MILKNRPFVREAPTKEAKSIYIFCEGAVREYDYFKYFSEIDSRINVEVYKLSNGENNSPLGLLEIAKKSILKDHNNPNPKYDFQDIDEVWIVLDTDPDESHSRKTQIVDVKDFCSTTERWEICESNPCFEVWLFFHINKAVTPFKDDHVCKGWKSKVHETISGGFNSIKHPILIDDAIENSKKYFKTNKDGSPAKGCTEVYLLGESLTTTLRAKLDKALVNIRK